MSFVGRGGLAHSSGTRNGKEGVLEVVKSLDLGTQLQQQEASEWGVGT